LGHKRVIITLSDETRQALKEKVQQMFGNRRGALSIYVEMVLRNELGLSHKELV
jgi:hypothetical protein